MKHLGILIAVLVLGAWLARPAESGGRAGAVYRFVTPPAFDSSAAAKKWLDSQGQNGFVLRTEVVLLEEAGGKLAIVPAAAVGKPPVTRHLLFQAGRN